MSSRLIGSDLVKRGEYTRAQHPESLHRWVSPLGILFRRGKILRIYLVSINNETILQ